MLKWEFNVFESHVINEARRRIIDDYDGDNNIPPESLRLLARSMGKSSAESPDLFQAISGGSLEELKLICDNYTTVVNQLGDPVSREELLVGPEVVGIKCLYEWSSGFDTLSWVFVTKPDNWLEKIAYLVSGGIDKPLLRFGPGKDNDVLLYAAKLKPNEFNNLLRLFVENEETSFLAKRILLLHHVLKNFDPVKETLSFWRHKA